MLCARWMQVKRLQDQVSRLQNENEELRGELNCFDPAFFDEIEDLKYNHNEMSKVSDLWECDHRSAAPARGTARASALMLHEMLRLSNLVLPQLVDRYETLLSHLSQKYNFDFTPQGSAPRSSRN